MRRTFLLLALPLTLWPGSAVAQQEAKIGPWAVDAHASLPNLKPTAEVAAPYGLAKADLPSRGLGLDIAAHWYPLSWRAVALGVGVGMHRSRGHQSPTEVDGTVSGADTTVRFTALSPQISVNFGSGAGWSYLSGGLGSATYAVMTSALPGVETSRRKAINVGGGARWFSRNHLAFSLDFRAYLIDPQAATDLVLQQPHMRLAVLSAGVSLK
jgi:hypothetical protein